LKEERGSCVVAVKGLGTWSKIAGIKKEGKYHNLAKWLSHYSYFFLFYFLLDLLHKDRAWENIT